MDEQLRILWKRLCRLVVTDPGRFAGGSAGLLAVEEEDLARIRRSRPDADAVGGQQ